MTATVPASLPPASFAQRRLWFLDRMHPGSSAYNVPVAVRLRGALEVAVLRRSLAEIVARHEALRTTLRAVDGEPVQVVSSQLDMPLVVRDLSGAADPAADLDAAVRAAAAHSFDLTTGPLLQCALLRVGAEEHVLLVTAHHLVIDGWSLGVFFRELSALYASFAAGEPSPLPELPVQYSDFAAWQRESLTAEALSREVDYWCATLAGAPPVLELPTQFPRSKRSSEAGAIVSVRLPGELTDDVDELCRTEGVTVFMTLLAAFSLLLSRYSGSRDVVVGSPIAGRVRPELEPLIGCFINTLPLRTNLSGAPPFRALLARVRAVTLGAYEHQNLPFEQIVDAVRPDRSVAESPIFQVMFTVNNTPPPALSAGPLTFDFLPPYRNRVKYDLNLTVTRSASELEVAVEYRTDLFGPEWIDRFLGHYRTLLDAAVTDPDRSIDELPLLSAAQRRQVLVDWNRTAAEFPDDVGVHELVQRQVAATPERIAVVFGDHRLTYRELDERANRVSHRLRELGVGRNSRVGLCLQRSLEMVIGLLGALKAGGAYVPLDPSYPADRLDFMVADADVWVVLTHSPVRDRVPPSVETVVELDADQLARYPTSAGPVVAGPDDSAYVIYTSGSTGRPKGVINTHRGIVNRLVWMQREYRLDSSDVVLQKTPYSFDVSVWEFLWPLLAGARLVLARPEGHKDPAYLCALIQAEQVSTVHFVPSMLQVFLDAADLRSCPSLRRVICSGEVLPARLARRFLAVSLCPLHNLYGPTEAAIDVSYWACGPDEPDAGVPIGKPVANTQLYILDQRGEPVPIGVPGELYIGGAQVAAGYLNRLELTTQRFLPNPFHGGRMYRTGDLARWRADGAVEFLGRLDHQVKVRGFRIELGEVEAAIRAQDGIRDVVVLARDDRLVGYVVGDQEQIGSGQLREWISRTLPDYMVPAVIIWLERLPLSPNGKVDRKALPDPRGVDLAGAARVTARDGIELELVTLWEELLDVRPIGVTDDFFALGGHSLQVIRLLSRITQRHGRELPVSVMFSGAATIERLARQLRSGPESRSWSPVVGIRTTGSRVPLFCLPPAVGNALCYVDLARHLPADQPVYGLQAVGLDAGQRPIRRLEDAAAQYVEAILSVQPEGPYRLVGYCVGSVTAFAVAEQLQSQGQQIGLLAVLDGGPPSAGNGFEHADEADIAAWFAWELGRAADRQLVIEPAELRGSTGPALAEAVLARAAEQDVLPPDTASAQLGRLLATFDATVRAIRDHELRPCGGPIVAFRAAQEPLAASPVPRWRPLAHGGLVIEEVPGDHYSMMRPPHVATLAAALDRVLTDVDHQHKE